MFFRLCRSSSLAALLLLVASHRAWAQLEETMGPGKIVPSSATALSYRTVIQTCDNVTVGLAVTQNGIVKFTDRTDIVTNAPTVAYGRTFDVSRWGLRSGDALQATLVVYNTSGVLTGLSTSDVRTTSVFDYVPRCRAQRPGRGDRSDDLDRTDPNADPSERDRRSRED